MTIQPARLAIANLPVEQLAPADLGACLELASDRQWAPEPDRWKLLFETGRVFGVRDPGGGLAGSVALTSYGPRLAAIGMVLVAARHERRGLGRALMAHALRAVGDTVTMLFATQPGRPLYEHLGFHPQDSAIRFIGHLPTPARPAATPAPSAATPAPSAVTSCAVGVTSAAARSVPAGGSLGRSALPRLAGSGDLPGVAELDRRAFGGDRAALLARLPELAEGFLVMDRPAGRSDPAGRAIRGYAASTPGNGTLTIGPLVAEDLATATALVTSLAAASELPLRMDVPGRHSGLTGWLAAQGVPVTGQTTIMTHGGALPGIPAQLLAPLNVAMG